MKTLWTGLFILAALFPLAGAARGDDQAKAFVHGIQAYEKGDYQQAVTRFQALVRSGVRNGKLYYNLGNAHMKKGDLGRAVLWYERAAQLIPRDPDLNFNRDYAASLVRDAPAEKTGGFVKVLFFWYFIFSAQAIRWAAIVLNTLFWTMIAVRRFRAKRLFTPAVGTVLVLAMVFALTAGIRYWQDSHVRYGVVIPDRVSVRSGFSQRATELFVLHAGTRLRIEQERDQGYRIRFSDEKIGWVGRNDLEPV